jgi:hypothetical protein
MISKKNIKKICPPIIWNWLSFQIKNHQQKKKKYDPRRWWYGEDLKGDGSRFSEIFNLNNIETSISMLNHEIRDCIKIPPNKSINLELKKKSSSETILFSFGNKSGGRSIYGRYVILNEEKKILDIKYPLSGRWNNVKLESKSISKEITIKNETNSTLYFACPIILKKNIFNDKSKINNIFLIILDQVDYQAFSELEKKNGELKFIEDFFKNGYSYKNCYSAAEWTLPCFSSIFSGEHPSKHGNFDLKFSQRIKDVVSPNNIISYLRNKGFSTFGISRSKGHHAGYNFQKYFDRLLYYDDAVDSTVEDEFIFSKKAEQHLEMNKTGKNFVFMHYMSSHAPYWKPGINEETNLSSFRYGDQQKEYDDAINEFGDSKVEPIMDETKLKSIIDRQTERIKNLDLILGEFFLYLEKSNLKKNSMVILTADHGPNHFGRKNHPMMNKSRLNVPLKIFDGRAEEKKEINQNVCQTDIFPIVKNIFGDEDLNNIVQPYGKKNQPVISESLFNKKYKVSIRIEHYTYYFSCKFDPINFVIYLKKDSNALLESSNEINIDEENNKKKYFQDILLQHLKKSKIIKHIQ